MATLQATAAASITGYLGGDYDNLREQLGEANRRVEEGQLARARQAFTAFYMAFRRHIRIEEDLVFTLIERRGGDALRTAHLRYVHRALEHAVDDMRIALDRDDTAGFRQGYKQLAGFLPAHQAAESRDVYPMADQLLSDAERPSFFARLMRE